MSERESHGASGRRPVDDKSRNLAQLPHEDNRIAIITQQQHPQAQRRASSLREHTMKESDSNGSRGHRRASFVGEEKANENGHRRASFVGEDGKNDHHSNRFREIQTGPQFQRLGNRSSPHSRSPVRSSPVSRSPVNVHENMVGAQSSRYPILWCKVFGNANTLHQRMGYRLD